VLVDAALDAHVNALRCGELPLVIASLWPVHKKAQLARA
jgi:hypothetical protein